MRISDWSSDVCSSDLHAGRYRIRGQKIFITWGEHELAENIIHLVLARLPDSPDGSRGISPFLVPKYHVNDDGTLGPRNDLRCVSLDRQSVVKGKRLSVRVEHGGRRLLKKKKKQ